MTAMLNAYKNRASGERFEDVVAQECRSQLEGIVDPELAVKYAVSLNAKDFLWDVLYDAVLPLVKVNGGGWR